MTTTSNRRRADVLWRRSLDAVVCLPSGATEPVTLAGTGPEIWELLERPHSLPELTEVLAARHGTSPEVVARDVRPVLEALSELGLIEPVF